MADYHCYVESSVSDFQVDVNQEVGYNWYQSHCSSDTREMNLGTTTPCYPTGQYYVPQNQVSNPNMYYFHEYEPPPTDVSITYASDLCAYKMFDTSSERECAFDDANFDTSRTIASQYTLTCHTTLSTGQHYYALESIGPLTTPYSTVASSTALISIFNNHEDGEEFKNIHEVMNGASVLVEIDGYKKCDKKCGDSSSNKGMGGQDEGEGLRGKLSKTNITLEEVVNNDNFEKKGVKSGVEEIENDIDDVNGDGSLTDLTGAVSSWDKLTNNFDDSVVIDNLLIHQNSSSITEYVEDFMHVKNMAEFIFKRDFDDDLLAFCFVNGLKEEIREALELWAPRTLQGAIALAELQASFLDERLLVEVRDVKYDGKMQLVNGVSVKTFGYKESGNVTIMKSGSLEVVGVLGDTLKVVVSNLVNTEEIHLVDLTTMRDVVKAFSCKEIKNDVPIIPARLMFDDSSGGDERLSEAYKKEKVPTKMVSVVHRRTLPGACGFCDNLTMGKNITRKITKMKSRYASLIQFRFIELNMIPFLKSMELVEKCLMDCKMDKYGGAVLNGKRNANVLIFDTSGDAHNRQPCLCSLIKEMNRDRNLNMLAGVNDAEKKQTTRYVSAISSYAVMHIIDQPGAVTLANDLDKCSMQKLSNVSDKEMRPDFYVVVPSSGDEIHSNMIRRDSKVFANSDNNKKFNGSWDMNSKEKIKGACEKNLDDKACYKVGEYTKASHRLKKVEKYFTYDSSFKEEKISQSKAFRVTCNLTIASYKLKLENKQAEKYSFKIFEDFLDQVNPEESFTYMVLEFLKTKRKLVLVDNGVVLGENYVKMKGIKLSVDKEKEEIYVRESLETKEAFPSRTREENVTLFLYLGESFLFVLYRFDKADGLIVAWFWNDIVLVFDPGDIINHLDRYSENILVCESSVISLLDNGEMTDVLDELRLGYASLVLAMVDNGPVKELESFRKLSMDILNELEQMKMLKLAQMIFDSKLSLGVKLLQLLSGGSSIKNAWYWIEVTLVFDLGNLFSYGVNSMKLVAAKMNEQGILIDDASGAPGKLQKSMLLERFTFHHDFNHLSRSLEKQLEVHTPWIWTEFCGNGISETRKCGEIVSIKRMVSAWYWSIITLVFDPGDFSCYPGDFSGYQSKLQN